MKKINILLMLVFTVLVGCKSKAKVAELSKVNNIHVSFISIGSGTDGKARKAMLDYLDSYQTAKKIALHIDTKKWGREGEIDYCILTNTLTISNFTELKTNLNQLLEGNPLVRMQENGSCESK